MIKIDGDGNLVSNYIGWCVLELLMSFYPAKRLREEKESDQSREHWM